jgi:hypothetical protein
MVPWLLRLQFKFCVGTAPRGGEAGGRKQGKHKHMPFFIIF